MIEDQHERLRGHRIRTTLKRVPGILADLEPTPKRGSGAGTSEPKLPISETVLEAGDVLRSVFVTWARITMEERHVPPPTEDTIPALAAYLTYHSEWLGRHPAGDEAEDEIADAVANLERLTDQPSATVFAGRCPECGGAIYGKEGRDGGDVHDTRRARRGMRHHRQRRRRTPAAPRASRQHVRIRRRHSRDPARRGGHGAQVGESRAPGRILRRRDQGGAMADRIRHGADRDPRTRRYAWQRNDNGSVADENLSHPLEAPDLTLSVV